VNNLQKMGKTSYQSLQKLVSEIEAKIVQLSEGHLPVSELEGLVKHAADLHERLAVIRYKAYEKYGEPAAKAEPVATPKAVVVETPKVIEKEPEEPSFDFTIFSEPKATEKPIAPKVEEAKEMSLEVDFSTPVFEAPKVEKKVIPVAEPEVKKPIHVIREEVKADSTSLHEKFLKEDEIGLNEKLKKAEEAVPLRKKLGLSPIADLKTEIGIGKKFEYINFLFAGDSKAYETAINELNTCANAEVARQKLNVYASVYKWDLEEKTIIKFVELVERRFL